MLKFHQFGVLKNVIGSSANAKRSNYAALRDTTNEDKEYLQALVNTGLND